MLSNKRGISLIVLAITIVIITILAVAVILSFNSNNPIDNAYEATFKSNIRNMYEELNVYFSDLDNESYGEFDPSKFSADFSSVSYTGRGVEIEEKNITEIITVLNQLPDYRDAVFIIDGKLTLDSTRFSEEQMNWAREVLENK